MNTGIGGVTDSVGSAVLEGWGDGGVVGLCDGGNVGWAVGFRVTLGMVGLNVEGLGDGCRVLGRGLGLHEEGRLLGKGLGILEGIGVG